MKLGVFAVLFGEMSLEETLDYIKKSGLETVELGTGNYPGNKHCNPAELLADEDKIKRFKEAIEKRGLEISGFSCHGNPLHPNKTIATNHQNVQHQTILLAEKLGVPRVITFSGCPGDCENSKYPNWVTCPWPDDYAEILKWQWEEKVIPFWKKEVAFAREHKVNQIALEMHPGFVVYNPETVLKLRDAAGEEIGANLDPSHLFWQGIDPIAAVKRLNKSIFYVHAKDTKIDLTNTSVNGVLDTKPYSDEINRSWIFRTVGYGHTQSFWKDFVSALRLVGYDDVLSIEHEDSLMSTNEGFQKAVKFLRGIILSEEKGKIYWA